MMNVNNETERSGNNTTKPFSSSALNNSSIPFNIQNKYVNFR